MITESFQRNSLATGIIVAARAADVVAADCTPPAITGQQNSVQQYVFACIGTVTVWVAIGVNATIPASGGNGTGFPLSPGMQVTESVPPGATVSVIAAAAGSTLYVMSGKGS